jgi:hypothetical protein
VRIPLAFVVLLALASVARAQAPDCRLPGAEALTARPNLRYVLVGEMHGTAETPRALRDLICSLSAARRPIMVGLERLVAEQTAIDAFLASDGSEAAVRTLLAQPGWNIFDGRSSQAMLGLFEDLRVLKRNGVVDAVLAFDGMQKGDTGAQRDERMGRFLAAVGKQHPDSLFVILTGNLHASKKPLARFGGYPWMAMFLPSAETVSLLVTDTGGETWTQQADGCGPHPLRATNGDQRGVVIGEPSAVERGYDGVLATGQRSTASRPALPDAPPPPACSK